MTKLDVQRAVQSGVDVSEHGRDAEGNALTMDRRLFMQLLAFGGCRDPQPVVDALAAARVPATVYADLNDPQGIGVLFFSESPDFFVGTVRTLLNREPFAALTPRPQFTMFGRTYSIGYEQDLERTLITRPIEKVVDPERRWAIWYPLRRKGEFEQISGEEQRTVLMEHGGIGMAYGRAGLGTDIRLACYGLDTHDNDFVVALIGPELAPLSKIVERMRKTKQTSHYLQSLGPFFIGKAIYQQSQGSEREEERDGR